MIFLAYILGFYAFYTRTDMFLWRYRSHVAIVSLRGGIVLFRKSVLERGFLQHIPCQPPAEQMAAKDPTASVRSGYAIAKSSATARSILFLPIFRCEKHKRTPCKHSKPARRSSWDVLWHFVRRNINPLSARRAARARAARAPDPAPAGWCRTGGRGPPPGRCARGTAARPHG